MTTIPSNAIGLTHHADYVDSMGGTMLEAALTKAGVPFEEVPVSHLVGVHATASLMFYTSPKTGRPVTVLVIHDVYEIDDFAQEYYYFDGMTREQALKSEEWWLDAYDQCVALTRRKT